MVLLSLKRLIYPLTPNITTRDLRQLLTLADPNNCGIQTPILGPFKSVSHSYQKRNFWPILGRESCVRSHPAADTRKSLLS